MRVVSLRALKVSRVATNKVLKMSIITTYSRLCGISIVSKKVRWYFDSTTSIGGFGIGGTHMGDCTCSRRFNPYDNALMEPFIEL